VSFSSFDLLQQSSFFFSSGGVNIAEASQQLGGFYPILFDDGGLEFRRIPCWCLALLAAHSFKFLRQ